MYKSHLKTLSLAILCSTLFTGCGGGGGGGPKGPSIDLSNNNNTPSQNTGSTASNNNNTTTGTVNNNSGNTVTNPPVTDDHSRYARRGRVIDGYVQGATVWLDLNNNAVKDDNEPSVVSTDKGSYELELTEEQAQCAAYVPTYVDVPVGAIDEDLGEVTKAYQMVLPPTLTSLEGEDQQHITPLTTVLWQSLYKTDAYKNKTCTTILADDALQEQLKIVMRETIDQVIEHYNISEQQLFSDYIESGDDALKKLAEDIVKGLQASVEKYLKLAKEYVDAHEIRVLHYLDTPSEQPDSTELVWYRSILIYGKDGSTPVDERVRMDDNLETVLFVQYDRKEITSPWSDNHTYIQTTDLVKNSADDIGHCFQFERLEVKISGFTYELRNWKSIDRTSQQQACDDNIDFSDAENRVLSVSYSKDKVSYLTEFHQNAESIAELDDWINMSEKSEILDVLVLVAYFSLAGYEFDDNVNIPFSSWHKRITDDSGDNRIITSRDSDGTWQRQTYQDDGTYVQECSTDGQTWAECSN
ncbi:hypothetical protein [Pseudoalteromonas sp. Of7M-16]|uniref:hypothetical protein n=1 Tax=Pseudoalteromonas sp. Of7M-16 TaxID=2917756 RepID=UPI001EF514DA|nr:hypothetical protein [Pseudoalteromonas sp. Of7M-16]MCG7548207.1 hypothetical protein [Pseudoalteromonas sp. Of7M-16]